MLNILTFAILGLLLSRSALATTAIDPQKPVLVTAFGDAAHIAGNGRHGNPASRYIRDRLVGVEGLRSPDLNFLNLEASLARSCRSYARKPFLFSTSPLALEQLLNWGFNLIGLANNHTIDCLNPYPGRESPFLQSMLVKDRPSVAMHGVAKSLNALVNDIPMISVRGIRIGFVSLKAWRNGKLLPLANLDNRHQIFASLAAAPVDIRILSLHGGEENTRVPNRVMREVAREFIAKYQGDVVFGHHSHTMQGYELVATASGRTAAIFYSLGNFLHNGLSKNGDGMGVQISVDRDGVVKDSIKLIPLRDASHLPKPGRMHDVLKLKRILRQNHDHLKKIAWDAGFRRHNPVETVTQSPSPSIDVIWSDATSTDARVRATGQRVSH